MLLETDNVFHKHSATLGQQLEALAAANADGLLEWVLSFSTTQAFPDDSHVFSDNAYRLLRQDLFQRFGPLAGQIPTEPGMVKMPLPSTRNLNGM